MTAAEMAAHLDKDQRLVDAAWAYELALLESREFLEIHLNLIAVYFALNEAPMISIHPLGQAISGVAFSRALEIIERARAHFGDQSELQA